MAVLDTVKYLDAVCRMISQGQENVPVPVQGVSMRPFLRNADFVYLVPITEPVKKGDILLFQRTNGQYVLHRVYKRLPGRGYWMLGDSQLVPEPVAPEQLRAKAAFVRRAGQIQKPGDLRWWFFACPWRWLAPWRRQISRIREYFRK